MSDFIKKHLLDKEDGGIEETEIKKVSKLKSSENTVKIIAKTILIIGIIASIIFIIAGITVDYDINWYFVLIGVFSLLFFTLPIWAVLTMLSNISTSLKK